MTAEHPAPSQPHPAAGDDELVAWRQSAATGRLPQPIRTDRWQVLRAGVVNMWEFDAAEYWFADGRTQFVGQNQTGKSTLMALTTLIMLAGDLDRSLVDTFGQQHKTFRYYVEPTDDPTDRRSTDSHTSRGWAWVEYGRIVEGAAQFFTTALYAQSKRGQNDFTRRWLTCEGTARVGDGLTLHRAQSTATPQDLAGVPGLRLAASGKEYKARLAEALFGFEDADRLDAVVRMLKVLRTPHLGQRLDPDFFTEQMRQALPAVAKSEIDELADGWDQLDRLEADREHTEQAQRAVAAYIRKAWGPWADAVLRRAADDLTGAVTKVDNVTRDEKAAESTQEHASATLAALEDELESTTTKRALLGVRYEELRDSAAYGDALDAAKHARGLRTTAADKGATAHQLEQDTQNAQARAGKALDAESEAKAAHSEAVEQLTVATEKVATAAQQCSLETTVTQYAQGHDVDRLLATARQRRSQIRDARHLLQAVNVAAAREESAATRAHDLSTALRQRQQAFTDAQDALENALLTLADGLEHWAATISRDGPSPAARATWIDHVMANATGREPKATLTDLITREWLLPLTLPMHNDAHDLARTAGEERVQAKQLEAQADDREAQHDPSPQPPSRWTRRPRPEPGPAGAPLWWFVEPVDGLEAHVLDHVEAALDAAGLLQAWVTPDGAYIAERDGHDVVLSPQAPASLSQRTISQILRPSQHAGPCAQTVAALLDSVTFGTAAPGTYAIAPDGRWQDPARTGHAAPGAHGATLLGAGARAAARAREVADLRQRASDLRASAQHLDAQAQQLQESAAAFDDLARQAPTDDPVVTAALQSANAQTEVERATAALAPAKKEADQAAEAAANARTALLNYTGTHRLPQDDGGLAEADSDVSTFESAVGDLRAALSTLAARAATLSSAGDVAHEAGRHADDLARRARAARLQATAAEAAARDAQERLGADQQDVLAQEAQMRSDLEQLATAVTNLTREQGAQEGAVARARSDREAITGRRERAAEERDQALARWWVPVKHGLAARRGLPDAPGQLLSHAVAQARAARDRLPVPDWPDAPAEKDARVARALSRMSGGAEMVTLRQVLESSAGRTVTVTDSPDPGALTSVLIGVDTSGTQVDPVEAVQALEQQAAHLAQLHDEKIQQVLVELLSSTFVEHLREQLTAVVTLLNQVNRVLEAHPTGANRTTMRLKRVPASAQREAFAVLEALEHGAVDSPDVQAQVRTFLSQQIASAQDLGRSGLRDWKEHLAEQLDYRTWFDVVTEYRVGDSGWKPLTKEIHAKDSGGGKVITLLQPLLATLVALYNASPTAPRPLWLDEAFTGVDDDNRATMLGLLVEFDLDFLLAGPSALVTVAQVPGASVWFVTRAPAPTPGVDLSMMVWAGRTLAPVTIPTTYPGDVPDDRHVPGDQLLDFSALGAS